MAISMRYAVNDGLHGLRPINKHTGGRKESMEKTLKSITKEEFDDYFNEHFRFTSYGPNLWRAYNKVTNESASPVYNNKDAAIYYVKQELIREMNVQIEVMLGGNGDITSIYDDTSLHSRLPDAITRNGTEEK